MKGKAIEDKAGRNAADAVPGRIMSNKPVAGPDEEEMNRGHRDSDSKIETDDEGGELLTSSEFSRVEWVGGGEGGIGPRAGDAVGPSA